MTKITLFGTTHCHLCEQAYDMLLSIQLDDPKLSIEFVDIADNAVLLEQYALTIPVIAKHSMDKKLFWPFNHEQLSNFVKDSA